MVDGVDPFEHFDGFKQWSSQEKTYQFGERKKLRDQETGTIWNLLQWPCRVLSFCWFEMWKHFQAMTIRCNVQYINVQAALK